MPLEKADQIVTHHISADDKLKRIDLDSKKAEPVPQDLDTWASLHLVESGQILALADRSEFTLGRVSDAQPIMPDIDLTPYQAYANGVSRLHAVLKRESGRVFIMDLGSSNGTYLNGKRITPNTTQPISHSDMVSLGKLRIQILLKNP
jgi:predicted component of type VI protein secretion system